jgi:hypothetical protein
MKFIPVFLIIILTISTAFAQRNPNTNAGKINKNKKVDTLQNKQTQNQLINNSFDNNIGNKNQFGAYLNYGTSSFSLPELDGIGFGFKLGKNLFNENLPISLLKKQEKNIFSYLENEYLNEEDRKKLKLRD